MSTRLTKSQTDSASRATGLEGNNIPEDLVLPSCTVEDVDRALFTLFNNDTDVIRFGREALLYAAFFQAFDALAVIFIGALRGAGDTRWTALAAFVGAWIIFLPMAYFLAFTLELGFGGAWLSATIYVCLLGLACVYRFRQGVWKKITI